MKSYIGIDWSEKRHNVCILIESGACLSRFQIPHTQAGFLHLEQQLSQVNQGAADCIVGIETRNNTLVDFLWSRDYTMYILPPNQVKSNRGRHRASRPPQKRKDGKCHCQGDHCRHECGYGEVTDDACTQQQPQRKHDGDGGREREDTQSIPTAVTLEGWSEAQ